MNIRQLEITEIKQLGSLLSEKYSQQLAEYRCLLIEDIHLHNGYIIGAFEEQELLGFAALDCQYISGFRVRLAELVARLNDETVQEALLERIKIKATELEAEALYICANPNESELEFYKNQGAKKAIAVDSYLQQLYEAEVHLAISCNN